MNQMEPPFPGELIEENRRALGLPPQEREHIAGADCWCCPVVDYVDPDTGVKVYVHRRPS